MQPYDPNEWYTPEQALKVLKDNSGGKNIGSAYLRSLARQGKIERIKLGDNFSIYNKAQVDAYVVEGRGEKLAQSKKKSTQSEEESVA